MNCKFYSTIMNSVVYNITYLIKNVIIFEFRFSVSLKHQERDKNLYLISNKIVQPLTPTKVTMTYKEYKIIYFKKLVCQNNFL